MDDRFVSWFAGSRRLATHDGRRSEALAGCHQLRGFLEEIVEHPVPNSSFVPGVPPAPAGFPDCAPAQKRQCRAVPRSFLALRAYTRAYPKVDSTILLCE